MYVLNIYLFLQLKSYTDILRPIIVDGFSIVLIATPTKQSFFYFLLKYSSLIGLRTQNNNYKI